MRQQLKKLFDFIPLEYHEARDVILQISEGKITGTEIGAIFGVYLMRPITYVELTGFRDALMELCIPIKTDMMCLDVCGTGGDGKNTFNISTLSAFVIAASGVPIAKHTNYGLSSISGSSNVLEYFGYKFSADPKKIQKELEQNNICFIHAPLFHPAMKHVGVARKEIGIKTFFNLLGPLVNSAKPTHKFIGTYSAEVARIYHSILQKESDKYAIIYSYDGFDEISLTSNFKIFKHDTTHDVFLHSLNIKPVSSSDIYGGSNITESAKIFEAVIKGGGTETQQKVVQINAAYAIALFTQKNIDECINIAAESINSKKAYNLFKKIMA